MTITELVQDALKTNNKVAVFAGRGSGKSHSASELNLRLAEEALIVVDANVRIASVANGDDFVLKHLLDHAQEDEVDIVLLGAPTALYNPDVFDSTWTKLTYSTQET